MNVGEKARLLDSSEGKCGEIGTIISVKPGPWGHGHLYDLQFEGGYVLPDILAGELGDPNKPYPAQSRIGAIIHGPSNFVADTVSGPQSVDVVRLGNKKLSLDLLEQIIEMARIKDKQWKEVHTKLHKGSQTLGDDSIIFHLERLKELLEQ